MWPVFFKRRIGSAAFIGISWLLAKMAAVTTPFVLMNYADVRKINVLETKL
jgi:hypothetical protein